MLINPPYSVGLEHGEDGRTGARHLRSALVRLATGGRAVAIMPEWFDLHFALPVEVNHRQSFTFADDRAVAN